MRPLMCIAEAQPTVSPVNSATAALPMSGHSRQSDSRRGRHRRSDHMGKLSADLIEEYFATHLPYRTRILLAHYRVTRAPWHGDRAQLEAAFEASLITGRMYLNVLGLSKNRQDVLVPTRPHP